MIEIKNDKLALTIDPKAGASIYAFKANKNGQWLDLMRPVPDSAVEISKPGAYGSFLLIPYSNRIENGKLNFRGQSWQLKPNNSQGHRSHGDGRLVVWNAKSVTDTAVCMEYDFAADENTWPWSWSSEFTHELKGNKLIVTISIKNTSDSDMPVGMGVHPYFKRDIAGLGEEEIILTMPMAGIYPDVDQIPTGHYVTEIPERLQFNSGKVLTDEYTDKGFAVSSCEQCIEWKKAGVTLKLKGSDIFGHAIVYCPPDDKTTFAVEPVTNCNNAFNMNEKGVADTGMKVLAPGETITGVLEYTVEL